MKAKLYFCNCNDAFRVVHNIYTRKSYEECGVFNALVEDVEVVCSNTRFDNFGLKQRDGIYLFYIMQNFILKFENGEVAELHRSEDVLDRYDDCAANRDAIRRFKEDIATAIAGKPELIFSEDEYFVI